MAIAFLMFIYVLFLFCSCSAPQHFSKSQYRVDACPKWSPVAWSNDIRNPENLDYVVETAFNLNVTPNQVIQDQFNTRYN